MQGIKAEAGNDIVLRLDKLDQTFTFAEVDEKPTLSVLRTFSAPVKLTVLGQTEEDLTFLLAHDTDSFSKWEAGQALQRGLILRLYKAACEASEVRKPVYQMH